jgi:hypothetical protein
MPLPEGRWTKPTNIEHYKMFATHEDAIGWFNGAVPKYFVNPPKAIPLTNPHYDVLEKELDTIWKSFVELFPRDTEGLTKPPFIVLTDSRDVNAFVMYDSDLGVSPHAFIVNLGVFTSKNGKANDVQLRGLIAHELAHHVLKHQWPGNKDKTQKWYSIDAATADGFGWQQKDDLKLREKGQLFINNGIYTGDYPLAEWNGVSRTGGTLAGTFTYVHRDSKTKEPEKCAEAEGAQKAIDAYLNTIRDPFGNLSLTAPNRTRLDELTKRFVDKEILCGASSGTATLWTSLAKQLGTSEATQKARLPKSTATIIDSAKSPTEALFKLVKTYDETALGLDASKLRYYSTEEEADDVSVNVLFRSRLDPNAAASFFEDIMLDDKTAKACTASANMGEPPYGFLRDPHHDTCWRIWHLKALVTYLSTPVE